MYIRCNIVKKTSKEMDSLTYVAPLKNGKRVLFLTTLLGHMLLMAHASYADSATVTISEITPLSFGVLEIPSGTTSITINANGSAPSGNANMISNTSSRAQFNVTGNKRNQEVTLDIQNINTGSSALTLSKFKAIFGSQVINNFPISNVSSPESNGTTLYLGATLTFNQNLQARFYNMSYDLVINYE